MSENKKIRQQRVCIILLLVLLIIMFFRQCTDSYKPVETAVIEENPQVQLTDSEKGEIRIKINPAIDVRNKTMQNINFCNYNKDRLLRCRIKSGDQYIYDSGFLAEGNMLKGDYIRTDGLDKGQNEVIAEVYSYDTSENLLGQTNVKITLNLS